jgi:hypothetical protein
MPTFEIIVTGQDLTQFVQLGFRCWQRCFDMKPLIKACNHAGLIGFGQDETTWLRRKRLQTKVLAERIEIAVVVKQRQILENTENPYEHVDSLSDSDTLCSLSRRSVCHVPLPEK